MTDPHVPTKIDISTSNHHDTPIIEKDIEASSGTCDEDSCGGKPFGHRDSEFCPYVLAAVAILSLTLLLVLLLVVFALEGVTY